jgi:hypothetical protein
MWEDLPMTCINAENADISNEPTTAIVAVVNGGDHLLSMDSEERTLEVNVVVHDVNENNNDELPWQSWLGITKEAYDEMYRYLHAEYKDFEKHHCSSQHKIEVLEDKIKDLHT